MFTFLRRFLSPDTLLQRARWLRASGDARAALDCTEIALEKLGRLRGRTGGRVPGSLAIERALALRGALLLSLGRRDEAARVLLAARKQLTDEPRARSFLVRWHIDKGTIGSEVLDLLSDYLRAGNGQDDSKAFREALADLKAIARPRPQAKQVRELNKTVASSRKDLGWPHLHLGLLDLDSNPVRAIESLRRACTLDPGDLEANALLTLAMIRAGSRDEARATIRADATESRPTMIVRALVYRGLGEYASAAEWFARVDEGAAITGDLLLVFAESLIRAGKPKVARSILARAEENSPRRALLESAVSPSPQRAVDLLIPLLKDKTHGKETAARLVGLIGKTPSATGAASVLDRIPRRLRDDTYKLVRSHVFQAHGDIRGAIDALASIRNPIDSVVRRGNQLLEHLIADLTRTGRFKEALDLAAGAPESWRSPVVENRVRHAMILAGRFAAEGSCPVSGSAILESVDRALAAFPGLLDRGNVLLTRGVLLAAAGRYRDAMEAFQVSRSNDDVTVEATLQLARCALLLGDQKRLEELLPSLERCDDRAARLVAAYLATSGRWREAHAELAAIDPTDQEWPLVAAVSFRSGNRPSPDAPRMAHCAFAYHEAVDAVRRGRLDEAQELCTQFADGSSLGRAFHDLHAWIRLRGVIAGTRPPEPEAAVSADTVANGLSIWCDETGQVRIIKGVYARLFSLMVAGDRREEMLRGLLQAEELDPSSRSAHCHALGLFHLSESTRHATTGEWAEAGASFEKAYAHLCVALADSDYLRAWIAERAAVYGVALDFGTTDLSVRAFDVLLGVLHRWRLKPPGIEGSMDASAVDELEHGLQAELQGAQRLCAMKGLRAKGDGAASIFGGPTYVALRGVGRAFAEAIDAAEIEGEDENLFRKLARLLSPEGGSDHDVDTGIPALRRLYSSLRIAAVLESSGLALDALQKLRQSPGPCFPLHRPRTSAPRCSGACDESSPYFARCNPAFASSDGAERLRIERTRLEASLLVACGERSIASGVEQIDKGIRFWTEALDVSGVFEEQTASKIRTIAVGRARVLDSNDREEEGILLLHSVSKLCGSEEIRGELASLHLHLGFRRANESGDWPGAITEIRAARTINSRSAQIDQALVIALLFRAQQIFEDDPRGTLELLTEALEIGQPHFRTDPHNTVWREAIQEVRKGIVAARIKVNTATADDLFEAAVYAEGRSIIDLSAAYHNRGLQRARGGDHRGALGDLTKALDLEPDSDETRTALAFVGGLRARRNPSLGGG